MRWKAMGRRGDRPADVSTVIDEGSEIEGKFTFSGTVLVNGHLRGEIVAADMLVIGERGVVDASITAGVVRILGAVNGDVAASTRVELSGHSRVHGNVHAPVVVIEDGAVFEGNCRMGRGTDSPGVTSGRDAMVVPIKRPEVQR